LKLWLINGITSVRDLARPFTNPVGCSTSRDAASATRSRRRASMSIHFFANAPHPFSDRRGSQARIRDFKKQGVDGVKFLGTPTNLTVAGIEEARRVGLRTTIHNDQLQVSEGNVVFLAEHGLQGMEHWYGLPESMFVDRSIQHYSNNYIYDDEQDRFGEAGSAVGAGGFRPASEVEEVMDTLLKRQFIVTPDLVPYLGAATCGA